VPQACASCGAENDDALAVCAGCGEHLLDRLRPGQLIAARYEILGELGRGGMGAVYRAYDRVLEEEVALKVLTETGANRSDARRRFRTEIKLARRVMHRNVCRIFEYGEEQGRRFISMELIQGTELKLHAGTMSPERAFAVAAQIADGLAAIHEVGVIHRDLKTSNIMLEPAGTVRLMDFGIAKHVEHEGVDATATGDIVGTPSYMSPEQARGEKLDFRSDIYSLGVVVYELFSGRVPFRGDSPLSVILKHIHDPPPLEGPAAPRLPPSVIPILACALAKPRNDRFQSAAEMGQALRAAAGGTDMFPSVRPMGTEASPGPTVRWDGPDAERARATTDVRPPTQPGLSGHVTVPLPGDTIDATAHETVLLPPSTRSSRVRGQRAIAAGATLAIVAALVLAARPWRTGATDAAGATPASTIPAAVAKSLVTLNALPWARVKVRAMDTNDSAVASEPDQLATPCTVELAPGTYAIDLENGGLTPPLRREIEVKASGDNTFVFTMPPFDPARAAERAVEDRP
jgi:serine/threonine protein kinase